MSLINADLSTIIFPYIPEDNHLNLQLVCKWTEAPKLKSLIDTSVKKIKEQEQDFIKKYGTIAKCERNLFVGNIRNKIEKILDLGHPCFFLTCFEPHVSCYRPKPCFVPEGLHLNFDEEKNPSAVIFCNTELDSPEKKYAFYCGTHLEKIYRIVEEIFEDHAKVVQEFVDHDLLHNAPKQSLVLSENNFRRLRMIEWEQYILNTGISLTKKIHEKFCADLSWREAASFYYSYLKEGFTVAPLNLVPLPLDSKNCEVKIFNPAPKHPRPCAPCCPPPLPPSGPGPGPGCY